MPQETQEPALTDLINEWMRGDPLLCQHFRWEWPKSRAPESRGFYIGTCYFLDTTSYAVGYVGDIYDNYYRHAATWKWGTIDEQGRPLYRLANVYYPPGDPKFFENFKAGLIAGHNSLKETINCSI
jgi:hypothetical protein